MQIFKRSAWNCDWLIPFDSNWSIINRFCELNCVSPNEFKATITSGLSTAPIYLSQKNLRKWNFNSLELLENNVSREIFPNVELSTTSLSSVMPPSIIKNVSSYYYLRFCPDCLALGYHCTLYQMLFIELCPIHNTDLRETCSICGYKISYELEHNIAFGCPHCRTVFWSPFINGKRNLIKLTSKHLKKFLNTWHWLQALDLYSVATSDCCRPNGCRYFTEMDTISLLRHWTDVVPIQVPSAAKKTAGVLLSHTVVSSFRATQNIGMHKKLSKKNGLVLKCGEDDIDNEVDIRATFKSIYRYIFKKILPRPSRQCYSKRCLCYSAYLKQHCPQVNAITNWLGFWTHCHGKKMDIVWDIPEISMLFENIEVKQWTLLHIFAQEVYWSFWNNYREITSSRPTTLRQTSHFQITTPYWFAQNKDRRMYFHSWPTFVDLKSLQINLKNLFNSTWSCRPKANDSTKRKECRWSAP